MWWLANPQDLHRISDRVSTVYIEKSHVDRADNAVVVVNRERTVRIPAAMIATLMLGPGTRVTYAAIALLANSGTAVCWVGEHGVRFYAAGLGPSRGSQLLIRQAYLVTRVVPRLAVARRMYAMRFPGEDITKQTMQQLRGREGARVKKLYRHHSTRTGVAWNGRIYQPGKPFDAGDDVNRLLSAAHSCLYALCHAAIAGLGASPGLGFVHTGGATSFVLDIADLYKATYTIPLAFDLAAEGLTTERDARTRFRELITDGKLMTTIVRDISNLLTDDQGLPVDSDSNQLWDETTGAVLGGVNWANHQADTVDLESFVGITGPDLDPSLQVDW